MLCLCERLVTGKSRRIKGCMDVGKGIRTGRKKNGGKKRITRSSFFSVGVFIYFIIPSFKII